VVEDLVTVLVLVLLPPLAAWLGCDPAGAQAGGGAEGSLLPALRRLRRSPEDL
jgi:monovalent cation:H+ antiporter-2, CPA2 family